MPRVKKFKNTPLAKARQDHWAWGKSTRQAKHRAAIKRKKRKRGF